MLEVKLIPGKNKYDITLQPCARMLVPVVVTGYPVNAVVDGRGIEDRSRMMGGRSYRPSIAHCRTFRKQHFRTAGAPAKSVFAGAVGS